MQYGSPSVNSVLMSGSVRRQQKRQSSPIATSALVEIQWTLVVGRPLLVLCLAQHALCCVYFIIQGALMSAMTPYETVLLQAWSPFVSSIVCYGVASLHVAPFVRLGHHCYGTRPGPQLAVRSASSLSALSKLYVSATHLVEVACETFLAQQMANKLTHSYVAYGYALCVTTNCWFTPWLFFLPVSGLLRMLVDFVDCLLSFLLSTGIPLFYHVVPLVQLKLGAKSYENSFDWLATNLPVARLLVVSSPVDLIATVGPNLSNFIILWRIVGELQCATIPRRRRRHVQQLDASTTFRRGSVTYESKASTHPTTKQTTSPKHKSWSDRVLQLEPRILKVMLVVNFIWGAVVLVLSTVSTFGRRSCPPFCVQKTAPWDHLGCNCLYVRLHCPELVITSNTTMDSLLNSSVLGPNVLLLLVKSCAMPYGLAADTMSQFPTLFAFRFQNTSMHSWDIPSSAFNTSVLMMQIFQSDLNHIPPALYYPHPRSGVYISNAPRLASIPSDVWSRWQELSMLWLRNCSLREFPLDILTMPYLGDVGLEWNSISIIPAQVADMPSLTSLHVDGNQVRQVPQRLLTASQLTVFAEANPIETLDWHDSSIAAALVSQRLLVSSTPFCDALTKTSPTLLDVSVVCATNCARNCTRFNLGDFLCTADCNTDSCGYDNGDCDLPFD
ncbi:hypothetical protein H257_08581 [Aphanomyces astaci]|uniref:LNR domain-containing protein n=2 Tax=Aphanomyces astaci TaxID=112090 RepID=W4GDF2_APHAT|nr:hypothetical protein H257_08581 [Aphanomyces astaci]ETV77717.1 hypothetical protein H257_08581 [Aphanomyces astaci]|eukprot:XP_009832827.1 hypothetical protein H257_08581 [Aphanomyces astaci]